MELNNENTGVKEREKQPIPAVGEESKTINAKQIAEFWDRKYKIPPEQSLNEVFRLYVWKIKDEEGNRIWERIDFPEDVPGQFFGLTKADLEALGGKGVYQIRLWNELIKDWDGSKNVSIGVLQEEPVRQVAEALEPPQLEEKKEEEEMDNFTRDQLTKGEAKIEKLEAEIKELNEKIGRAQIEAQTAKSENIAIKMQKESEEKRLESEKQALIRERDDVKKDLEKEKERHTERYDNLQTDFRRTVEAKDKEIGELKEKLNEAKKDKEHFQYESLLAKAKGEGGDGSNALTMKVIEQLTGLKTKQLEVGSEKEMKFGEMFLNYLIEQATTERERLEIEAESSAETPPSPETPSAAQQLGLPKFEQLLTGFLDPINKLFDKAGLTLKHKDEFDKAVADARAQGVKEGVDLGATKTAQKAQSRIEKARQEGIKLGKEQAKKKIERTKPPTPAEPTPEPKPKPQKSKKK